ncbi:MAG: hypothetical protein IJO40_11575 [Thermoguttaceae bacterium]|nr:hypothetical protein [Thermoguttaceae bacterium]
MKEFKVYKYPIEARMTSIEVPDDSRVLSVANQYERAVVYIAVGTSPRTTKITVFATVTGYDNTGFEGFEFLGTLLFQGGSYVAHYFYRRDD